MSAVGPTNIMKVSNTNASAMFSSESILTPPSSPRTTELIAIAVITAINKTVAKEPVPQPNKKLNPESACVVPNPKEVVKPKSVAKTANISMRCPQKPHTLSPNNG